MKCSLTLFPLASNFLCFPSFKTAHIKKSLVTKNEPLPIYKLYFKDIVQICDNFFFLKGKA